MNDEDEEGIDPNPRQEWRTMGLLLDHFNSIESQMARIISLYIGPRPEREEWLETRLLNNSIISFSAKLKMIQAISRDVGGPKINADNFQKMLKIRNALAHGNIMRSFRHVPPGSDIPRPASGVYLVLESIENNGEVKAVPRTLAIGDFWTHARAAGDQVVELLTVLDPRLGPGEAV